MAGSVALGVAGAIFLVMLYQHIRVRWPENYFAPRETLAQYFTQNGARFLVFRFLPPLLVFLIVGAYAANSRASIVSSAASYATISTALSVRSSAIREQGSVALTPQRVAVLVSIVGGVAVCAFAAILVTPAWAPYVPPVGDVVANLVAAGVAAGLAIAYFGGTISKAREAELDESLVTQIRAMALENSVDQQLALAIAYVENAQRPQWFRRLEGAAARFHKGGSYGIFQVKGHGFVDDVESCRIAMGELHGTYPLLDGNGWAVDWSVKQAAERHNPDYRFAQMVADVYPRLFRYPVAASSARSGDGRPLLEVSQVGRFANRLRVRGTYWAHTETVVVEATGLDGAPDEMAVVTVNNTDGRAAWYCDIPIGVWNLTVRTFSATDDCFTGEELKVDLRVIDVERDLTLRG